MWAVAAAPVATALPGADILALLQVSRGLRSALAGADGLVCAARGYGATWRDLAVRDAALFFEPFRRSAAWAPGPSAGGRWSVEAGRLVLPGSGGSFQGAYATLPALARPRALHATLHLTATGAGSGSLVVAGATKSWGVEAPVLWLQLVPDGESARVRLLRRAGLRPVLLGADVGAVALGAAVRLDVELDWDRGCAMVSCGAAGGTVALDPEARGAGVVAAFAEGPCELRVSDLRLDQPRARHRVVPRAPLRLVPARLRHGGLAALLELAAVIAVLTVLVAVVLARLWPRLE